MFYRRPSESAVQPQAATGEAGVTQRLEAVSAAFAESTAFRDTSWDAVLERRRLGGIGPVPGREKVLYIGDIHGASPEGLDEDLRRVGLLDNQRRWQNPQNRYLVQVGDLIDRGEHGLEIYDRIAELQTQAQGRLIRLFGNHEQFHLAGIPGQIRAAPIPGLQERLFRDVISRNVVAAFSEGNTIYTHAGIDLKFFPEFVGMAAKEIVATLNERFVNAVRAFHTAWQSAGADHELSFKVTETFLESDPIFDTHNGIFWTRSRIANDQFQQVVGHTPQESGIRDDPGDRVKYVDVGRIFGELGHFNLVRSRAVGANTANSRGLRELAHDYQTFLNFVRGGGKPFVDGDLQESADSLAGSLLKELEARDVERVEFDRGREVNVTDLCNALEKLERQQPAAVRVFIMKYFGNMSIDDVTEKMTGPDRKQVAELWQAVSDWLSIELFPK